MGVTRPKYDNPAENETVNLTYFFFGFRDQKTDSLHVLRSKPMKISLHEKSALTAFLSQWLGESPKYGFDTATLKSEGAQITVSHVAAQNGKVYANITGISPVMQGLEGNILPVTKFAGLLAPLEPAPADEDDADEVPF